MKPSDVRVEAVKVTFSDEQLAVPLRLSKGVIAEISYAQVTMTLATRQGQETTGRGAILLSDVWAFPHPTLDHAAKDGAMRAICTKLAQQLPAADHFSDPLEKHELLEEILAQVMIDVEIERGWTPGTLSKLAALNCLSPFDAAIHDGWGRAIGRSVYQLYTAEWLNADLGTYLGSAMAGRYPSDYLVARRPRLCIQHVVGVGDALTPETAPPRALPDLPSDLTSWIKRDSLSSFKIKTKGQDPLIDAQRVADVYATARAALPSAPIHLSVDPNESCPDAAFLLEMLDALALDAPAAFNALEYIEQPTGRDLAAYTFTLHEVAARKPVILDESFDSLAILPQISAQGWTGIAVKTCKGQSSSLLAYCWAKAHGCHITLQDLTNPGRALVHSANLCAHLALTVDSFECNNRQYMPHARPKEQAEYPDYFRAQNGMIYLPAVSVGLY